MPTLMRLNNYALLAALPSLQPLPCLSTHISKHILSLVERGMLKNNYRYIYTVNKIAGCLTCWLPYLDGPPGWPTWMAYLDGLPGWPTWMAHLDGPPGCLPGWPTWVAGWVGSWLHLCLGVWLCIWLTGWLLSWSTWFNGQITMCMFSTFFAHLYLIILLFTSVWAHATFPNYIKHDMMHHCTCLPSVVN